VRSLTGEVPTGGGTDITAGGRPGKGDHTREEFEENLVRLKERHHSACLFGRKTPGIPEISASFDATGILHGTFTGTELHQGYNGRMHGGLIAAIVDASMTQCLMGHGVVGYTADLKIKYRQPVMIAMPVVFTIKIVCVNLGLLYTMSCEMAQNGKPAVEATAKFYKFA
jgi:hypothetical protein